MILMLKNDKKLNTVISVLPAYILCMSFVKTLISSKTILSHLNIYNFGTKEKIYAKESLTDIFL